MLIKILGIIDLISGILLLFAASSGLPSIILIILGVILIAKSSLGLWKDFASWIDVLVGISFIALIFYQLNFIVRFILAILILQKGFFSFFE